MPPAKLQEAPDSADAESNIRAAQRVGDMLKQGKILNLYRAWVLDPAPVTPQEPLCR